MVAKEHRIRIVSFYQNMDAPNSSSNKKRKNEENKSNENQTFGNQQTNQTYQAGQNI